MNFDYFTLWIGRIVTVGGGLALATCLLWQAAEYVFRILGYARNAKDVVEALSEWKERHPDKYARLKQRDGAL